VLNRLSLEIPAGSSLAIVGQNGAGKTTLAKLLCRLYDPQSGAIEADGTDLRISVEVLATKLESSLPGRTRVERRGGGLDRRVRVGAVALTHLADQLTGDRAGSRLVAARPRGLPAPAHEQVHGARWLRGHRGAFLRRSRCEQC